MSYFGLTANEVVQRIGAEINDFGGGDRTKANAVIAASLDRNYRLMRSMIPQVLLRSLTRVEQEFLTRDADASQTVFTLGAPASSTPNLYIWKYDEIADITTTPKKADAVSSSLYTFTSPSTVTFATGVDSGSVVLASYNTSLVDDCPSLQQILVNLVSNDIVPPRYPERATEYLERYREAIGLLTLFSEGKASPDEIKGLDLLDDFDPVPENRVFIGGFDEPA